VDNPTAFVSRVEHLIVDLLRSPDLKTILALIAQNPLVLRFCELVMAVSRPQLVGPDPGTCVPSTTSTDVVISVGFTGGSYTINIIDAGGSVVHSCSPVVIDPITHQGTCTVPPGTLPVGANYTIEVVTGGTSHTTLGWFCTN
jgi:hypothetical protein